MSDLKRVLRLSAALQAINFFPFLLYLPNAERPDHHVGKWPTF